MQIIYPTKTDIDVIKQIQKYDDMIDESQHFPIWWILLRPIVFVISVYLGVTLAVTFAEIDKIEVPTINTGVINPTAIMMEFLKFAVILLIIAGSIMLKGCVQDILFPESTRIQDYTNAKRELCHLIDAYQAATQLQKNNYANISFELCDQADNGKINLDIVAEKDGEKKHFMFQAGTYKIRMDKENIIDLSILDERFDKNSTDVFQ